jgi:hypothetical protein
MLCTRDCMRFAAALALFTRPFQSTVAGDRCTPVLSITLSSRVHVGCVGMQRARLAYNWRPDAGIPLAEADFFKFL